MARTGRSVLLLLLIPTVLSLLMLSERRLTVALNPIQRKDLPAEIAIQGPEMLMDFSGFFMFWQGHSVKDSKLNALPLETLSSLKEPVGDVLVEEPLHVANDLIESADQELLPGKRANRVLSETTSGDGAVLKGGDLIDQVTRRTAQDGGLVTGSMDQQEKHTGSQQQSSSEVASWVTWVGPQTIWRFGSGGPSGFFRGQQSLHRTGRSLEAITQIPQGYQGAGKNPQKENTDGRSKNMASSDTRVRDIKDHLIKAKVYLGLGAIRANPQYLRDLRHRIREVQKVLGEASKDSDLPKNANEKVKALEQTLVKGEQTQDDCSVVVKKLRAMLHSAEEQLQQQFPNQEKLDDPKLYHYALFSDNILATAVVVNSTVLNAKHPSRHVFHIVTDRLNYAPMRMWFLSNPPGKATIEVHNIDEFTWLNDSSSLLLKQLGSQSMIDYYFTAQSANSDSYLKYRNPKYLSMLNHLRFYLPEIYPKLDKMVFLDGDVVVRKDITGLWSIDMKGKVNGAVETCGESFHSFDRYLNFSSPVVAKNFDPNACVWAFGMNMFDLAEWRRQNITEIYHFWQKLNEDGSLRKLGTLPLGLVTFWNKTFPLDRSWHVLGLGYNPHVSSGDLERAAVIHYNGNMKPWLEIGLPKFRSYWSEYLDYDQPFLRECNINP
uniref:Hexosyltransferase n=1 Tax=Aegilops tauschii TaxID=37682 RepID=M8BMT9_AEGTA